MFQFPGFAFVSYVFRNKYLHVTPVSPKTCIPHDVPSGLCAIRNILGITGIEGGLPHSEIRGSKVVRTSPRLIAAYHVLHRLLAPRHPPDTLKTLDRSHYQCPPLGVMCRRPFTVHCIDRKTSFASNTSGNAAVCCVHDWYACRPQVVAAKQASPKRIG